MKQVILRRGLALLLAAAALGAVLAGGGADSAAALWQSVSRRPNVSRGLLRWELGEAPRYWDVENWKVNVASAPDNPTQADAEAVVKLRAGGQRRILTVGEGNGPVNALDHALRQGLTEVYPEIARFELTDFKVRIMDASHGTDAVTRVLITTTDSSSGLSWRTVGVGPNVIEASWEALTEALFFGLLKAGVTPQP